MEQTAFLQLSLVIVLSTTVAFIVRLMRQPLILGYIFAGLLAGPSLLNLVHSTDMFETFSNIGVALLLFIVGLGLNIVVVKRLGKAVFLAALAELIVVGGSGYVTSQLLGFSQMESIIVGLALFFSSTIIIVKVLSDKKEQGRLHGQIAIGVILLDDVVATFALLFIAAQKDSHLQPSEIGLLLLKGLLIVAVLSIVSAKILPRLTKFMAGSQELLFLFALSWGFGIASLSEFAGFSIEVGALFAGVALAPLPYVQEIGSRLKPLRDFFLVIFFLTLGVSLNVTNIQSALVPALVLSIIVILLKPITIMGTLGLLGYTKRVSFKTGINLSQISEFSIILVVLAQTIGLLSPHISTVITLVAIITITSSTYLMLYDNAIFARLENHLHVFEKKDVGQEKKLQSVYPLVLFGYRKGGHEFVRTFREMKRRYIVIDYNPEVIETLENQHIHHMYGDATDLELLEEVGINQSKIIVSTITDYYTNRTIIKYVRHRNQEAVFVCHADSYNDAVKLYEHGATYVMLPHFIGSERMSAFILRNGDDKKAFDSYRNRHVLALGKVALAR